MSRVRALPSPLPCGSCDASLGNRLFKRPFLLLFSFLFVVVLGWFLMFAVRPFLPSCFGFPFCYVPGLVVF